MTDTLGLQTRLPAAPGTVYRALTEASALREWLAEHAEADPAGGRFEFWGAGTPQSGRDRQRLLSSVPDRRLRFAWTLDGTPTTVDIELEPDGEDRTVLRLHQDGMPSMEELMAPAGRRDGLHSLHTFWTLSLANLAAWVEGRPLVPRADFRPERPARIELALEIAAPADAVFASLVEPALTERWFGWPVEIDPRPGGRVVLGAEGRIFEFEPGRRLAYSEPDGSITRWELEGTEGRTRLTFVQSGYQDEEWDSTAQHEAGWLGSLAELRRVNELGAEWAPLVTDLPATSETPGIEEPPG